MDLYLDLTVEQQSAASQGLPDRPGLELGSHLNRTRSDSLTQKAALALHVCHVPTCVWRAPARSVGQLFARSRVLFFFFIIFFTAFEVLTTYI